jgi:anti-anti-sigma factor
MRDELSIDVHAEGAAVRLELHGELDLTSTVGLRACLDVLDPGWRRVTIDLAGITFLDSNGIHELLRVRQRCAAERRQLEVVGARPNVRRVLDIAGIDLLDGTAAPGDGQEG